jgi:2-polyprenyl-3-methyl-5-hydroxy-6-metoxy-1,4-benzoquinol methylase
MTHAGRAPSDRIEDADTTARALALLRSAVDADTNGYVHLQTAAYRTHHLLAREVLRATEPGDRVFECGVSSGYFASVLVAAGLQVDGHELDATAAARAREVCGQVFVGDLSTFDPDELDGTYRVLLFGDTLEHLPDPAAVLRRLGTRLDPGGVVILSIPNIANWAIRLSLLAGRFDYADRGIMDRTHLRFYTRRSLVGMVTEAGFRVERLMATVPVPFVRGPRLGRATHQVGNALPGLFGYGFILTARQVA